MKRNEILSRALGPAAPELTCEQCFKELDHYVELVIAGEPADQWVPGMHAHLDGCPACAEDFRSLRDLVTRQKD